MSLHVCSRVRVSQPPYSGGHHLNLILLATLGTYHGDNRSLALSTKRLRTFLSRYTKSPLHGEVCQHACAPVKSSSRIKVDIHLQKTIPLIPCMTGFFWFFPPTEGLAWLWSQESCVDHSQLWKPTHLGACSHAPAAPLPVPGYWAAWKVFSDHFLCSFRIKKHRGVSTS